MLKMMDFGPQFLVYRISEKYSVSAIGQNDLNFQGIMCPAECIVFRQELRFPQSRMDYCSVNIQMTGSARLRSRRTGKSGGLTRQQNLDRTLPTFQHPNFLNIKERMMKIRLCVMAMVFVFVWGGIAASVFGKTSEVPKRLLILADVSGSMQKCMKAYPRAGEDTPKVHVLKNLLVRLTEDIAPGPCETGIYRVRYIPGDKALYESFLPIGGYEKKEVLEKIQNEFITDYSVFNRRTPLADMFRQLDEQEMGKMEGKITLLLISDGQENFYGPENEKKGPLAEIRRLKKKYEQNLTLHTIFLGKEDSKGDSLLEKMAALGLGKSFSGRNLLEDESRMTILGKMISE